MVEKIQIKRMEKDIYDIENWKNIPTEFFEELKKKFEDRKSLKSYDLRNYEIDHVKLYCLLKSKVSEVPNGLFTMMMDKPFPLGNIFWWDFVIESKYGFVHFYRSQSKIEVATNIDASIFDVIKFVTTNLKKFSKTIDETKKSLEIHSLYVNHYMSYWECTKNLWLEINTLTIAPEAIEKSLEDNPEQFKASISQFISNNVKFHTYGKSILLNAAFMIEAYLTLLIRVTAKKDLKAYPDILKKHVNSNFTEKLKNLKYYSFILKTDVDLNHKAILDTLKVIELRNKYVHADLSSKINDLGTVHFDGYFPVFPAYKYSPIIENIVRVYQVPSFDTIKFAYDASSEFVRYLQSLFIEEEIVHTVNMIMMQNPIGFNQDLKVYSAIFSNLLMDARFFK
jgi:hypothetical protein